MHSNNDSATARQTEILLVDDDDGDVLLTQKTFEKAKIYNNLHVVRDGCEALEFLRRNGDYAAAQRPDLILLDMHMPNMDGMQTLKEIAVDSDLASIPIFILTSSLSDIETIQNQGLPATNFIEKPVDLDKVAKIVKSLGNFWFSIVRVADV